MKYVAYFWNIIFVILLTASWHRVKRSPFFTLMEVLRYCANTQTHSGLKHCISTVYVISIHITQYIKVHGHLFLPSQNDIRCVTIGSNGPLTHSVLISWYSAYIMRERNVVSTVHI
jgi:hypothetical protein